MNGIIYANDSAFLAWNINSLIEESKDIELLLNGWLGLSCEYREDLRAICYYHMGKELGEAHWTTWSGG